MLKLILKNLKNNKVYYFLIVLGYIATITILSISASLVKTSKDITVDFNQGDLKKQKTIEISSDKESLDIDKIIEISKGFSKDNAVTISGFSYSKLKDKEKNEFWQVPVNIVVFDKTPEWLPKLVMGEYFSPEQSNSNKKIAVVGSGVILNNISTKKEINILGDNFKIIGSVGKVKDFSDYLGTVFLPSNSIPEKLKRDVKVVEVKLYNYNGNIEKDIELLTNKINTSLKVSVEELSNDPNNSIYYKELSKTGILSLVVMVLAITNIGTLIYFMISKNRRQLVTSIAIGLSKRILIKQLFYTLMILASFASIIALLIQYMITPALKNNLTRVLNIDKIQISLLNIIIVLVGIIIISLVISILSVKSIYKEDLSKELKND